MAHIQELAEDIAVCVVKDRGAKRWLTFRSWLRILLSVL